MKKIYYILLLSVSAFTSCVYPIDIINTNQQTGLIVVEGDILAGDISKFYLTKSTEMTEYNPQLESLFSNMYVECDDGAKYYASITTESDKTYKGMTKYLHEVDTRAINISNQYRLVFEIDGATYASSWLNLVMTPPIDEITTRFNRDTTALEIMVSTHSDNPNVKYYRWSYDEDWEFHTTYWARLEYFPEQDSIAELPTDQNRYFCWSKDKSSQVLIANTSDLSENVVSNKILTTIYNHDYKISYLYAITVHQRAMSEEAYVYWNTMLENNDNSSGLFGKQPNEMIGNIRNVDNPEEIVLGYVSACTVQTQRLFVDGRSLRLYRDTKKCEEEELERDKWWRFYYGGMRPVRKDMMSQIIYWSEEYCTDCRARGTKNKPSFWPTDNI